MRKRAIFGKVSLSVFRKELSSVKTPQQLAFHAANHQSGRAKEIAQIIQTEKPRKIGKYAVYFCDFKDPKLRQDTGFVAGKLVFLEKRSYGNIPEKFLKFVLRHEFREELLMIAGYPVKPVARGSVGHRIAMKKELHDLQKAGLLKEYLEMLKKNIPKAFEQRVKAWNIDLKTLEQKKTAQNPAK